MAERKHLLHVRSNQLVDGKAKLPTEDQIDYGEIAINYADGNEKISIKNQANEIVTFSSDEQNDAKYVAKTELDDKYASKERVSEIDEVVSKAFSLMNASCGFDENLAFKPTNSLIKNAKSVSDALNIVANKAMNAESSLSSSYKESELVNEELNPKPKDSIETAISKLHKAIKDNEIVDSAAFDRIKESCGLDANGKYIPTNELINTATSLSEAVDIIADKANSIKNNGDGTKFLSDNGEYKAIGNEILYLGDSFNTLTSSSTLDNVVTAIKPTFNNLEELRQAVLNNKKIQIKNGENLNDILISTYTIDMGESKSNLISFLSNGMGFGSNQYGGIIQIEYTVANDTKVETLSSIKVIPFKYEP